jgi:phosphoglycolate phosphatase-like HAD superfamily hydrolase
MRLAIVAGLALCLSMPALAQDTTEGADEALERNAQLIEEEAIKAIATTREEVSARIDAVMQRIDTATQDIEEANTAFDELISTLKEQAEIGAPEGPLVSRIARLEELARLDAADARTAGFTDFEAEFIEDADRFAEQERQASSIFESLDRRIRKVEQERERIVFLIKLQRYDDAQEVIQAGIGELQSADERLSEIEASLENDDADIVR